jgi:hypothetical protein
MIPYPGLIDLDHLSHRLKTVLVTIQLPCLHSRLEEAANPESAKDAARYRRIRSVLRTSARQRGGSMNFFAMRVTH